MCGSVSMCVCLGYLPQPGKAKRGGWNEACFLGASVYSLCVLDVRLAWESSRGVWNHAGGIEEHLRSRRVRVCVCVCVHVCV